MTALIAWPTFHLSETTGARRWQHRLNENAQHAPSERIAPRECEWKHGDSGHSAGEENVPNKKETRIDLTPTGLLMEGDYTN